VNTPCKICEKKRARRYCPGTGGDICPTCCGTERENTVDCPLDCPHLQAARHFERPTPVNEADFPNHEFPNKDIRLTEDFLKAQDGLVIWLSHSLARAIERAKAVDADAGEALAAMIQTYRTAQSGLIYESKPANPYAAAIQDEMNSSVDELRKRVAEETGGAQLVKDSDIMMVLVFLERLHIQHNNGRRKSRAFLDFLRGYFPTGPVEATTA
jgi:hypothetical protein